MISVDSFNSFFFDSDNINAWLFASKDSVVHLYRRIHQKLKWIDNLQYDRNSAQVSTLSILIISTHKIFKSRTRWRSWRRTRISIRRLYCSLNWSDTSSSTVFDPHFFQYDWQSSSSHHVFFHRQRIRRISIRRLLFIPGFDTFLVSLFTRALILSFTHWLDEAILICIHPCLVKILSIINALRSR